MILAGFKYASESKPQLPFVVAVNSDESMRRIGKNTHESQTARARKVAEPLADAFPHNRVIVLFYDEETPNELYTELHRQGHTYVHHKWGYGTEPSAPKIEGAEFFECVYAYPTPNDIKPVCWENTPVAKKSQDNIKVVDLRGKLIATDGVLFKLPNNLTHYQSPTLSSSMIFFVSSIGDTDLAQATIDKLLEMQVEDSIFLVPVTLVAQNRIKNLMVSPRVEQLSLADIVKQPDILSKKQITAAELEELADFVAQKKVCRAYVGVPSPLDEEIPFQIADSLKIPCTIAYEYMFSAPASHQFWHYLDVLAAKENCDFAVPLNNAKEELLSKNKSENIKEKIHIIGHLSIDSALAETKTDTKSIRAALSIDEDNEFVFASGTTQPTEVDKQFLAALLNELSTGNYPRIQLRFGIHPGVKDGDNYLKELLEICANYPESKKQFKIILTSQFKAKLQSPIFSPNNEFILESDVSGSDAEQCADKIVQAVPGALLNKAALKGKPAYFHEKSSKPYLPPLFFSDSLAMFFNARPRLICSRKELDLEDTAPNNMLGLMCKR
jgi:hypothetical protein